MYEWDRNLHRHTVTSFVEFSCMFHNNYILSRALRCSYLTCQSYFILPLDHAVSWSLQCPCWPGIALCEKPSWECPGINLGLAQDCLGLLRDGGGLAVPALFQGREDHRLTPWLNRRWMQPHPQPKLFLDVGYKGPQMSFSCLKDTLILVIVKLCLNGF